MGRNEGPRGLRTGRVSAAPSPAERGSRKERSGLSEDGVGRKPGIWAPERLCVILCTKGVVISQADPSVSMGWG